MALADSHAWRLKAMSDETKGEHGRKKDPTVRHKASSEPRAPRPKAPMSEPIQHLIGSQLRAAYDEVVQQPVPDKFLELLKELEAKQEHS
jgi:hypothetical protein